MTGEERDRRDSRTLEPELITDPQAKAAAEARNGFRQYDAAIGTIHGALDRGSFKLRPSLILGLQREALAGIGFYAGLLANQLAQFYKSVGGKLPS
jgi:fructose/tagatose bisphosphate aldolase